MMTGTALSKPWHGWNFHDGFLVSPNGDRFTPELLIACEFVRQTETFRLVFRPDGWQWRC